MEESELLRVLDTHDDLVVRCARGDLTYPEFDRAYDAFFQRYALDGHESTLFEQAVLERQRQRILVHRRIWDEVIVHATSAELAMQPEARRQGFLGPDEARLRLLSIAQDAGLLPRDEAG